MKKLILLLFIPLVSFGQEITIVSAEDGPVIFSQETIDFINGYGFSEGNIGDSQKIYVDFDNDGNKDIISHIAGDAYNPHILCVFLWDDSQVKYLSLIHI